MKETKKMLRILLISYVIIIIVNVACNYSYYAAGNSWTFSIFFSLGIATLGVLGGNLLARAFFINVNWTNKPILKMIRAVIILAFYGCVLMIVVMKGVVFSLHKNLSDFDFVGSCVYAALISIVIGLIICGQQFLISLKKSIEDNEHMKQEMIQSQYETLKSQVNPHFLFNSLNTLTVMIPNQPEASVTFVEQLSKVFRYSLQYSGEQTIDISTELKAVRAYLFLNEQRYGSKLSTDIYIEDTVLTKKVITQSLLMLAENAIKHNEISHEHPLSLSIYNEGDYIVVKNTLQRKQIIELSTNVGLENIKKRYALTTSIPVIIYENNGFFIVKIPMLP